MSTRLLLPCFALLSNLTFAATPKISRDLESADPQSTAEVIVQFAHAPTEAHHQMINGHGGSLRSELPLVRAGVYAIPVAGLERLASESEVLYVSPNRQLRGSLDNVTSAVNASAAWNTSLAGAGIGIALIDSGVTPGQDIPSSQIVYNQYWVGTDAHDGYGHGTHVAGILAGSGAASHCYNCFRNLQGLAPGAKIVNLRVLDQNGAGTDSNVIAAINTAIRLPGGRGGVDGRYRSGRRGRQRWPR